MAATLLTMRCSAPGPARGELNATTSPVKTALRLGLGMQRISSLSTVLLLLLLLVAEGLELLCGLAAFAFRVGAMAAPAGASLAVRRRREGMGAESTEKAGNLISRDQSFAA